MDRTLFEKSIKWTDLYALFAFAPQDTMLYMLNVGPAKYFMLFLYNDAPVMYEVLKTPVTCITPVTTICALKSQFGALFS